MILSKLFDGLFQKLRFVQRRYFFLNGPLLGFLKRRACFVGLCCRSNDVRTTSVKKICANVRRRVQKPAISYRNATQCHDGPKFNTLKREITLIGSHTACPGLTERLHRRGYHLLRGYVTATNILVEAPAGGKRNEVEDGRSAKSSSLSITQLFKGPYSNQKKKSKTQPGILERR